MRNQEMAGSALDYAGLDWRALDLPGLACIDLGGMGQNQILKWFLKKY